MPGCDLTAKIKSEILILFYLESTLAQQIANNRNEQIYNWKNEVPEDREIEAARPI